MRRPPLLSLRHCSSASQHVQQFAISVGHYHMPPVKFHIAWESDHIHLVYHCWERKASRCCELSSPQTSGMYFELLLPGSSGQRKEGVCPQLTGGEWAARESTGTLTRPERLFSDTFSSILGTLPPTGSRLSSLHPQTREPSSRWTV